jgi:hypothetical protein
MSNYDYRPDLEEQLINEEKALKKMLKLWYLKEIFGKLKKIKEEANDSIRDDRKTPPC